jgi:3-oxoacyl-ACP reductase-like protein
MIAFCAGTAFRAAQEGQTMPSIDLPSGTPIDGAVALVTGGNRGFGRAVVDELLERGAAKVYATSRSRSASRARS